MPARSYGQFCGLARALEHVGDRWTLLIVRQLLTGPRRYVDLHRALGGISTNVLAERLHRLEADGLVVATELPAPARTPVWALTAEGEELEPVVLELLRFGTRYLADPERRDEPAHDDWAVFPLRWLARRAPVAGPWRWRFEIAGDPALGVVVDGRSVVLDLDHGPPDLVLAAPHRGALAAVLSGAVAPPGELAGEGELDPFVELVRLGLQNS